MKNAFFTVFALMCLANYAHAETSTAPSLVDYLDILTDKFENYLDDSANKRREVDSERARIVPKGAEPEIIIRRSGVDNSGHPYFSDGLIYNGQKITTIDPPSRAIEVFGPNFRRHENRLVWDELGISIYTESPSQSHDNKPGPPYIKFITIELNPTSPPDNPSDPAYPSHYFSGYLELDGAGIDAKTKIWEVRALVNRVGLAGATPYIICFKRRPVCEIYNFGNSRREVIDFDTDMNQHNGTIYSINIGR